MPPSSVLVPGSNCWRLERAHRAALLIDGDAYFRAFVRAAEHAERSIWIIGWDLDSRLRLWRDAEYGDLPSRLGDFLNALVQRRRELEVRLLLWDFALVYALEREFLPVFNWGMRTHRRVDFRLDDVHPMGASQHQKLVVIDDQLAFSGGLDLCLRRWDTQEHDPEEPARADPYGEPYDPFHDVQAMVDGPAAKALAELARWRWRRVSGEDVPPTRVETDPWPADVPADLEDVAVGIARTLPRYRGEPEVREVEQLYLDAIAAARRCIYIENQYITSHSIAAALEASLQQGTGPEVVIVAPKRASGWLEHRTMDALRTDVFRRLLQADHAGRLRLYAPDHCDLEPEHQIFVHAKVAVFDDALLRIGSANLTSRSMGLDSECDLAFAALGRPRLQRGVARFRHRLVGEHLGLTPTQVGQREAAHDSLIAVIDAAQPQMRTLVPLDVPDVGDPDTQPLLDRSLVDPERPVDFDEFIIDKVLPETVAPTERKPYFKLLLGGMLLVVLALMWRISPLERWMSPEYLSEAAHFLRQTPLGPAYALGAFVVGGLIAFPITLLILQCAVIFGPLLGFVYAMLGATLSGLLTYWVGRALGRRLVRKLAGTRLNRISRTLAERGILTVILVRLVPVAPFTVVNVVAGASHIRFRDFAIGNFIGMLPGTAVVVLLGNSLAAVIQDPTPRRIILLAGVVFVSIVMAVLIRRWSMTRTPI